VEYMAYLYHLLKKNLIVTDRNRATVIEALKGIMELLLLGDQQNDDRFFSSVRPFCSVFPTAPLRFFLEHNILECFANILSQNTNKAVKIELIQTMSILLQNLQHTTSICLLRAGVF